MATAKKPLLERMEPLGKFLVKWGGIAMAVSLAVWAIGASFGDQFESQKSQIWDLSQRREKIIQETRTLPEGEWVTITFPCYRVEGGTMWYQITASPHIKVEYDFLDGTTRQDAPGRVTAVKQWPPVIKVRAKESGKMELTLNQQFLQD